MVVDPHHGPLGSEATLRPRLDPPERHPEYVATANSLPRSDYVVHEGWVLDRRVEATAGAAFSEPPFVALDEGSKRS